LGVQGQGQIILNLPAVFLQKIQAGFKIAQSQSKNGSRFGPFAGGQV